MAEKWEYYWSHQWFLSRVYILSFSHITWTLSRHFNMNQKILFITVWPDLFSTQTRDDDTSCWWRKLKEGDGANPSEMCLTVFVSSSTSVVTLHFIQNAPAASVWVGVSNWHRPEQNQNLQHESRLRCRRATVTVWQHHVTTQLDRIMKLTI